MYPERHNNERVVWFVNSTVVLLCAVSAQCAAVSRLSHISHGDGSPPDILAKGESQARGMCCDLLLLHSAAGPLYLLMMMSINVMWSLSSLEIVSQWCLIFPLGAQQQTAKWRAGNKPAG